MKKPEVTLRNHEAVYEYYAQYEQPKVGAYIGHKAMSLMFRPNVEYAEGAQQTARDILNNDGRL
ncbi:1-acyl-sn-glycerol-3-phosphate acyltransferase, partial [Candidatus Saccharibacteria bacterium]|nr:1-acyl-sn-glycerol-3-phosphate acyltransferase [Candidatus Saccharibacteria bacterium]